MVTKLYNLSVHLVVLLTINHNANHHTSNHLFFTGLQTLKFLKMSVRYELITLGFSAIRAAKANTSKRDVENISFFCYRKSSSSLSLSFSFSISLYFCVLIQGFLDGKTIKNGGDSGKLICIFFSRAS